MSTLTDLLTHAGSAGGAAVTVLGAAYRRFRRTEKRAAKVESIETAVGLLAKKADVDRLERKIEDLEKRFRNLSRASQPDALGIEWIQQKLEEIERKLDNEIEKRQELTGEIDSFAKEERQTWADLTTMISEVKGRLDTLLLLSPKRR